MTNKGPIVIVEDDPDDLHFLEEAIEVAGFTNARKTFVNGREALDYLASTTDHLFLILCDINMPVMNGLELSYRIDQDPVLKAKSIPFVFLTTTDSMQQIKEAYRMTVQGFFKKPPSSKELNKVISDILQYWKSCRHPNN